MEQDVTRDRFQRLCLNVHRRRLTDSERMWFQVNILIQEIEWHGTLGSYFNSDQGRNAVILRDGLIKFGAIEAAQLVDNAITAFPEAAIPSDLLERHAAIRKIPKELWDEAFTNSTHALKEMLPKLRQLSEVYVLNHRSEFPEF